MPKYTVNFFITYWKKGKAVSIHAMSTNRVKRGIVPLINPHNRCREGRGNVCQPF